MERRSTTHDHAEKNINAIEKEDSDRWKRGSLYGVPPSKPRPESTSEGAHESFSSSRDYPVHHDGSNENNFNTNKLGKREMTNAYVASYVNKLTDDEKTKFQQFNSDIQELHTKHGYSLERAMKIVGDTQIQGYQLFQKAYRDLEKTPESMPDTDAIKYWNTLTDDDKTAFLKFMTYSQELHTKHGYSLEGAIEIVGDTQTQGYEIYKRAQEEWRKKPESRTD